MQRNDQKTNDLEFNRLKKLMVLEGVDTECLQKLDRYDSKLAVQFQTSPSAQELEQEFKKIKFVGTSHLVWSRVSKNGRPQIFSYMMGAPRGRTRTTKRVASRSWNKTPVHLQQYAKVHKTAN